MQWRSGRRSDNIEDRRGMSPGLRRGGIGGIGAIVVALIAMYFGVDPSVILDTAPTGQVAPGPAPSREAARPPADDSLRDFVSVVLADTEDTWREVFREANRTYQEPKLVLFTGAVESACGFAQAAVGPFYCPADRQVYIDLAFYRDLKERFRAPGDFAQAYVIAHEVGHHVQTLLGISQKVESARRGASQAESNALSVRLELQADCLAGLWANRAHRARKILESGDVEEGLNAAAAIGDDRLQRQSGGRVMPDSFTHGSSAQRVEWFKRGLESGRLGTCDTFAARRS
jgi:predicted metalloprotease